jgi:DNA-binding MarR family transcriptional regulator
VPDRSGTNPVDSETFAKIDKLVHEPARLALMATLAYVERADATFLQKQTGLTWGNLSSHVSKLEAAGYVAVEKTFVDRKPKTLLQLTEAGRTAFAEYRTRMLEALEGPPPA